MGARARAQGGKGNRCKLKKCWPYSADFDHLCIENTLCSVKSHYVVTVSHIHIHTPTHTHIIITHIAVVCYATSSKAARIHNAINSRLQ